MGVSSLGNNYDIGTVSSCSQSDGAPDATGSACNENSLSL